MTAAPEADLEKSAAAGAAQFVGSDSRRYNYFDPKGRKATHYEDVTVDVQPDPKRYLLQDWIMNLPTAPRAISRVGQKLKAATGTNFAPPIRNGSAPTTSGSRPSSGR